MAPAAEESGYEEPLELTRRKTERQRVIRRVQIMLDTRTIDAVLLDVSEQGAQIQLGEPTKLPDLFVLREPNGQAHHVARRWVLGNRVGVALLGDAAAPPPATDANAIPDMLGAMDDVRANAVNKLLVPLARAEHFEREEVRVAARDVALAIERLRRALTDAMRPGVRD